MEERNMEGSLQEVPQLSHQLREVDWENYMIEELMETNVISDREMAILMKEGSEERIIDPGLIMNLRHDKELRADLYPEKNKRSEVLAEAKRVLEREEKEKKSTTAKNKMIEDEINRFQNHITGLRKMNKRLERLASSSEKPVKKKNSIYNLFKNKVVPSVPSGYDIRAEKTTSNPCVSRIDKSERSVVHNSLQGSSNTTKSTMPRNMSHFHQENPLEREFLGESSLMVHGNKLDEQELVEFNPNPFSRSLPDYKSSVFDLLHLRYEESEKTRIENDQSAIRHTTPVDFTTTVNEGSQFASTVQPSRNMDVRLLSGQRGISKECNEAIERKLDECFQKIFPLQGAENPNFSNMPVDEGAACLNESIYPSQKYDSKPDNVLPSCHTGDQKGSHISKLKMSKPSDLRKIDLLSHVYSKWMTQLCKPDTNRTPMFLKQKGKHIEHDRPLKEVAKKDNKREEKIAKVLLALKHHKAAQSTSSSTTVQKCSPHLSKSSGDISKCSISPESIKSGKLEKVVSGSYEHRLKAQKSLITEQKAKIEEQVKIIQEFKLSQLKIETERSKIETQKNLNYVLQSCNGEIKSRAKTLKSSLSMMDLSPGNTFVLRMEERALERERKKQLSLDRRRQLDEDRLKKAKECEEQKRREEQEVIRKKHERLREMRRIEREMREKARQEREKMLVLERRAEVFSQKRVLCLCMLGFKRLVALHKKQLETAEIFFENRLVLNSIRVWKNHADLLIAGRMDAARQFYRMNLLTRCFRAFIHEAHESAARQQVAEDMHELRLQERVFRHWLHFTQKQHLHTLERLEWAHAFYQQSLLRRCLHHWQKVPVLAQQEREKERRKMVWRHKVQEVLPDFRPVLSTD